MDHRELTLAELLADPMILAVMAADRVDPAELKAMLSVRGPAGVSSTDPAERIQDYVRRGDWPW